MLIWMPQRCESISCSPPNACRDERSRVWERKAPIKNGEYSLEAGAGIEPAGVTL